MIEERVSYGKKLVFFSLLLSLFILFIDISFKESPKEVVFQQFKAIIENKITESYYAFTSKDFQQVTTLSQFKVFLKNLPFIKDQSATLKVESEEKGVDFVSLEGVVKEKNGVKTVLDYQVVKEEGEWKIQSVKVVEVIGKEQEEKVAHDKINSETDSSDFDFIAVQSPIKSLISLIRQGELKKAFDETTSKEFRASTPFDTFTQFISTKPEFLHNLSIRFLKLTFDGNVAEYQVELTSTIGNRVLATYYLILEEGSWKIIQIQVPD